jgi:hypothetical protein
MGNEPDTHWSDRAADRLNFGLISWSRWSGHVRSRPLDFLRPFGKGIASLVITDLPIEGIDRLLLAINLRAAKQIGLEIPDAVLSRADKVFE